jgi:hypothetical protein
MLQRHSQQLRHLHAKVQSQQYPISKFVGVLSASPITDAFNRFETYHVALHACVRTCAAIMVCTAKAAGQRPSGQLLSQHLEHLIQLQDVQHSRQSVQ